MMVSQAILKELTVEAERLEREAKAIREAIAVLRGGQDNGHVDSESRLEQLTRILREKGPLHRRELVEQTDIPKGTLATLLKAENFDKDDKGRWAVKSG